MATDVDSAMLRAAQSHGFIASAQSWLGKSRLRLLEETKTQSFEGLTRVDTSDHARPTSPRLGANRAFSDTLPLSR